MQQLPLPLAPLAAYRQFIVYVLTPSTRKPGKLDKLPVHHATGVVADAHDPDLWTDFATAAASAAARGQGYGVGFVFTEADPFWFLDIDGCFVNGAWTDTAQQMCAALEGCAVEVSVSGTGMHLIGTGAVPDHGTRNVPLHMEFYHRRRFMALGGRDGAIGDASVAPPRLAEIVTTYFPPAASKGEIDDEWWSAEPVPEWRGPTDDGVLLDRAMRSASARSAFGQGARFVDLWTADATVLGRVWPPDNATDAYNASHADAALAQHLAFWTGNDAERILRLMQQSMLSRPKWERPDYLPRTIRNACSMQREWLIDAPAPLPPTTAAVAPPAPATGLQAPPAPSAGPAVVAEPAQASAVVDATFLTPEHQAVFFAGCVYIKDAHRVLLPDGMLARPEQFKAIYGGRSFVMDRGNERVVRNAFEAFTENQAVRFPKADTTCFSPKHAASTIIHEGGLARANTYVPIAVPRVPGDVARFWRHMSLLFPIESDRLQVMAYMSACVQHQGDKFQWAPLIQGVPGNGKTWLAVCVQRAIGKRYVEWPKADKIGDGFNAWLEGKVFYAVDEIYVPEKRLDLMETLKPMITGDEGIQVTPKGVDARSRDICGNFLFLTNHQDGLRKQRNDRRVAPYFTPQQTKEDLARCGMGEAYFADLIDWCKGRNAYAGKTPGYHHIAELLWTWEIPHDLDPRFHVRAPMTSSTEDAIQAGLGFVEQHVAEAIAQQEVGFKGGWASSTALERVLDRIRRPMAPAKYRDIMQALGYDWHPALPNGRVNNQVMPDGTKPRLFVLRGHASLALNSPADVARAYSAAQMEA